MMKLEDNTCPICLYIFVEPVTMPCNHELCLTCFKQNVEEANFCCPICRLRISTWARRAARNNSLINEERWSAIKAAFPVQVRSRLEGLETEDEEMNSLNISIKLAEPGEIRNEYMEQMRKLQEQRAEERRQEQEASEQLIRQLQEEERKTLEEMEQMQKLDEQLAKKLTQFDDGDDDREWRSSSGQSNPSRQSNASSIEILWDKLPQKSSTTSLFQLGISPVQGNKEEDKADPLLSKKIKNDENLITTHDIEALEESFKKGNTPCMDTGQSCIIQTPSAQSGNPFHRKEILDSMSSCISINIDDEESNQSAVIINPKPVLAVDSPLVVGSNSSDTKEKMDVSVNSDNKDNQDFADRSRSADSISHELNHFRPIRSCPLTPPRRLPSGKVIEPMLIRTTPRNMSKSGLGSPLAQDESLADIDAGSPIMRRRLSELAEERKDKVTKYSKSTSTVTGLISTRRDENLNPDGKDSSKIQGTPPITRDVGRDISNSRYLADKAGVDGEHVKKKLIVPLEPDLTENDEFLDIEPLIHSSPVVEPLSKDDNSGRLSRKRKVNNKRNYTESPQSSLLKWVKPVNDLRDNESDKVEGNERVSANGKANDESRNIETRNNEPRNNRTRTTIRTRSNPKSSQHPDYLYENFKKCASRKLNSNDGCCETLEEQGDINSGDDNEELDDFVQSPKRRKVHIPSQKDTCSSSVSISKTSVLKHGKMPLRLCKNNRRKQAKVSTTAKKAKTKTLHDFFEHKEPEDLNLTQEEKDRQIAERLQKQYEMEAKFKLNTVRFKGTKDQYSLRTTRKKTFKVKT